MKYLLTTSLLSVIWLQIAQAANFDNVDISAQANFSWPGVSTQLPGNPIDLPGAPIGQTILGGVPFNIASNSNGYQAWSADLAVGGGSNEAVLTLQMNIFSASTVYTLINTWAGQYGPSSFAALKFYCSDGSTYTKSLVGGVDIRDYNNGQFTDSINNTTTVNVWNTSSPDDNWGNFGRLDMQAISLPSQFLTNYLTEIQLIDDGSLINNAANEQRTVFDGLTVETVQSVPEPSSALFGLAAFAALAAIRLKTISASVGQMESEARSA